MENNKKNLKFEIDLDDKMYSADELSPLVAMKKSLPDFDYYWRIFINYNVLSFSFVGILMIINFYVDNFYWLRLIEIAYHMVIIAVSKILALQSL